MLQTVVVIQEVTVREITFTIPVHAHLLQATTHLKERILVIILLQGRREAAVLTLLRHEVNPIIAVLPGAAVLTPRLAEAPNLIMRQQELTVHHRTALLRHHGVIARLPAVAEVVEEGLHVPQEEDQDNFLTS